MKLSIPAPARHWPSPPELGKLVVPLSCPRAGSPEGTGSRRAGKPGPAGAPIVPSPPGPAWSVPPRGGGCRRAARPSSPGGSWLACAACPGGRAGTVSGVALSVITMASTAGKSCEGGPGGPVGVGCHSWVVCWESPGGPSCLGDLLLAQASQRGLPRRGHACGRVLGISARPCSASLRCVCCCVSAARTRN